MSGGLRYDDGKLAWHLVPMHLLEGMVRVLMFGAKKYSGIFAPNLKSRCGVQIVESQEPLRPEDFATAAMKDGACVRILSLKSASGNTSQSTQSEIETSFWRTIEVESPSAAKTHSIESKRETTTSSADTDYHSVRLRRGSEGLVDFVGKGRPLCTLTTVIRLGEFEVSFAVSATTGLDSSTTMLRCLERLLGISLPDKDFIRTGAHNWRKGHDYSRITNSLQRHLNAFQAGEEVDPESGLPHVDHILCNALFLSGAVREHPELDDRYKKP